eukprot:NODE_1216_length_1603_cov_26.506098_g1147_i0.p1 GENE.NODE_1216_length_1603_cov_26.506098_g1147_i0~~NODE_1216_length_1603_cov_26.506098_g1147_i0.p1  ORF type:complete len:490 (+),score=111.76 NODE_1216_length_1603_cov_26.506098_g1147_i0:88-1470(+)
MQLPSFVLSSRCLKAAQRGGSSKWEALQYFAGFGNYVRTETLPNSLPQLGNTPQRCPYGLYAEQLSGSAFTAPRHSNQRSWLYRILPSTVHGPYSKVDRGFLRSDFPAEASPLPDQLRWDPFPLPTDPTDWVQGLVTVCGAGSPEMKAGMAIHMYACNQSMERKTFMTSDGDLLIVPQQGTLSIQTEFGLLTVAPGEICVIQRQMKFKVLVAEPSRGYIAEVYDSHFVLPDLGPIGANGLANPQHFLTPSAHYEDTCDTWRLVHKFGGQLFAAEMDHSPFDVVGWHGNYAPYKYDLSLFCPVNSVGYDHLDPSIFTVLTAQTNAPGVAACDFVIFPPRYMVQEDTFRPPYYHRNCMSEYMGNIRGVYEAKSTAFSPGGGSLHSLGSPHGPDSTTFAKASTQTLKPVLSDPSALAFMFESHYMFRVTPFAQHTLVQPDYWQCWQGLRKHFDPTNVNAGIGS